MQFLGSKSKIYSKSFTVVSGHLHSHTLDSTHQTSMPPQTTEMMTAFLGFLSHPNSQCLSLSWVLSSSLLAGAMQPLPWQKGTLASTPWVGRWGRVWGVRILLHGIHSSDEPPTPACSASFACLAIYKQDHAIVPPLLILGSVKSLLGHQVCCDKLFLWECTKVRPGDPVMSFELGFLTGVWVYG